MTVGKLRFLFKNYNNSEIIHFVIDETNLNLMVDNYKYQPHIEHPYKDKDGKLIVPVTAIYQK